MAKSKGRIGSSLNFILIIFAIKKIKENDDNKVKDSQYLLVIDSKNLNIKNKRKIVMIEVRPKSETLLGLYYV